MDVNEINLISINRFCELKGISRSTFYRKAKKGEFNLYTVPCSKRYWLASPSHKEGQINKDNILDYLEQERQSLINQLSVI